MSERPQVKIVRIENNPDDGTFGALQINGRAFCVTLERPWKNNEHGVSCIPAGKYVMVKRNTPKHGRCFEILDVPDRSAILIHWGNWVTDVQGCVLVGHGYGNIRGKMYPNGKRGIDASQKTFADFMQALSQYEACDLIIEEAF